MENERILTITGSDSTGESGIQADIRTITALGARALSVVTSITLQNTIGIQDFYDVPADIVSGQLDAIIDDVQPAVVKVGMMRTSEVVHVVVRALKKYRPSAVVYDPILFSSRGDRLMGTDVIDLIRRELFPLSTIIVVRKRESEVLLNDYVGNNICFIDDSSSHGYVNDFSSAVAVYLSKGESVANAIDSAQTYISRQTAKVGPLEGRSGELYNQFISLVADEYRTTSNVSEYASRLNVSGRYLAQVCRRIAGRSPKSIIDSYVVKGIATRLATTSDSIQTIAHDFGFANQSHLSNFFKNLAGISPTEYRKKKG